ncbi:MAG TPA: hypothetical protein VKX28_32465 [Xanthobacteraceae bacterium]|jgi:hypothetical protein|nr:hypothetical protein [Xanthobacteraceae bacterium]
MSTKLALAAAALVAVLAGPALAHEHAARPMPANAYASARMGTPAPIGNPVQNDFQLQGRP